MQHFSHHHDEVTASAVAGDVPSKPAASGFTALTSRYAIVDRLEQAVIVVLWAAFFWRALGQPGIWSWLAVASEGGVVVFVLLRRSAGRIATDLRDWLLAFGATAAPLLLAGNLISLWAKAVLRRSFGIAPANRGLKLTGPYRLVRHPMYSGYLLTHLGVLALIPSWFNFGVYAVAWTLQILRLQAEERLLAQDEAYALYRQDVRYRLLPGIY